MSKSTALGRDIPFMIASSIFCFTVGLCVSFALFKATVHVEFIRWLVELSPKFVIALTSVVAGGMLAICFVIFSDQLPRPATDCLWFDVWAAVLYGAGAISPWKFIYEKYFSDISILTFSPLVGLGSGLFTIIIIALFLVVSMVAGNFRLTD